MADGVGSGVVSNRVSAGQRRSPRLGAAVCKTVG
jgi:hypothetical protein